MKIENAAPYLGALVTDLDVKRMTDDEWKTLYQTWLDRHVLIVRGQDLGKADFLAYSRRFGRLKPHLVKHTRDPENPEITLMGVTSMAKDTKGEKLILDRGQAGTRTVHGTRRSARAHSSMQLRFRATVATLCLRLCMRLMTRCPSV
jgi:hypothetical protein